MVHGSVPGKGSRATLGSLEIGSYLDGKLESHGRVGSGLSKSEIERLELCVEQASEVTDNHESDRRHLSEQLKEVRALLRDATDPVEPNIVIDDRRAEDEDPNGAG